ncbi:18337_t:CDS:1, partial [Gigaspora margarita]
VNAYSDESSEFDNFKIYSNNTSNKLSLSKIINPDVIEVTEDEENNNRDSNSKKPIYPILIEMIFKH